MRHALGLALGLTCTLAAEATTVPPQQIGMIADAYGLVFVFDTDPLSILGTLRLTDSGAGVGDCVISPDGSRGYVIDSNRHVWVIDLASIPPQLAPGINPIPLSGLGVDVASTADGRFLVVCDSGFENLVSVVEAKARREIGTFDVGASCSAVDVCSDGSVLVSSVNGAFVRRLAIDAAGHLSDTGQRLSGVNAANVYCSPNGAAGVAMSVSGHLRSFRVSGMTAVSDRNLSAYGASGAMAKDGTKFYGRSFDNLTAFAFDQATAALGAAPSFTASIGSLAFFNGGGADQLALDFAGSALYTPERWRLQINDAATGAALPPLLIPDLMLSSGLCFGPQAAGCNPALCDDGNACTDDGCGETGCVHVPDDANACGAPEDCIDPKVCSAGACVSAGPVDCNAPCPPGFTISGDECLKTYDVDAGLLDNLSDSCDGGGADRYHCGPGAYGFHWIDVAELGVGDAEGVDLTLVPGRKCGSGWSALSFNGVPYSTIDSSFDCACSPVHTPYRIFPDATPYVKKGVNTISIVPTGTCEGLSASPFVDGLFARVTVSYRQRDRNCISGVCDPSTGRCEYAGRVCDDGNPCTNDTCDAQGQCIHTPAPDHTSCEDANFCNGHEYCEGGVCESDDSPYCFPTGDICTTERCDPAIGCVPEPIDCSDGNPCTVDSCDPSTGCVHGVSGLREPTPQTRGHYARLCYFPHSGDRLTDADAACVRSVAPTFNAIFSVADICNELPLSPPNDAPCDRADDELMVLALNICHARLCVDQPLVSQCGTNTDIGASLVESDAILSNPMRNETTCAAARCLLEEINNGRALGMNTLVLGWEGTAVRLTWSAPLLPEGAPLPTTYHVWRRPLPSFAPFAQIGVTTETTFGDATPGSEAVEYEVTAVME